MCRGFDRLSHRRLEFFKVLPLQFSMVLFVFPVLINEFIKRIRNRKKLLRVVAWATRLPLALIAFFPHSVIIISENCTATPQVLTK